MKSRGVTNRRYHMRQTEGGNVPVREHNMHYWKAVPMSKIRYMNEQHGGYFFSKDTMKFFRSKIASSNAVQIGDKAYFITSEQFVPSEGSPAPRKYTVREVDMNSGDIKTHGDFNQLERSKAQAFIANLKKENVGDGKVYDPKKPMFSESTLNKIDKLEKELVDQPKQEPDESKNLCKKEIPYKKAETDAYEVWASPDGSWKWYVLKKWQSPKAEKTNPYSRWFCKVTSPFAPSGDLGDVYVNDIKKNAVRIK